MTKAQLTRTQIIQLAAPLIALVAVIWFFSTYGVVGAKRPPSVAPSTTLRNSATAPLYKGMTRPAFRTIDQWQQLIEYSNYTANLTTIKAAGITPDKRWGYLALLPAEQGSLPGRVLFYRTQISPERWQIMGLTTGDRRIRTCEAKPPISLGRILKRDRFVCGSSNTFMITE